MRLRTTTCGCSWPRPVGPDARARRYDDHRREERRLLPDHRARRWNGDLVINNHGFDFNPPAPNPGLGPLAALQLSEGYAVAASSYSNCCWTLFSTQKDLNRLSRSSPRTSAHRTT